MRIRLKTGFWEMYDFEVELTSEAIRLQSTDSVIIMPLSELERFSVKGTNRFTIETAKQSLEGRFESIEDAKTVLAYLSDHMTRGLDVDLTAT